MPRAATSCSRLLSQGRSHQTLTFSQSPHSTPLQGRVADVGKGRQLLTVPTPCSKGSACPALLPGTGAAAGTHQGPAGQRSQCPRPRGQAGRGAGHSGSRRWSSPEQKKGPFLSTTPLKTRVCQSNCSSGWQGSAPADKPAAVLRGGRKSRDGKAARAALPAFRP